MILQQRKASQNLKRTIFIVSFLALSIAHFIVFWLFINVDTIRLTFFKANEYNEEVFVGFYNYAKLFKDIFGGQDKTAQRSFFNSFHAVGINLIILPISIVVAYAFYKKVYGYSFYRIIFYLPSIISIVVLAAAFREMFRQYDDGTTIIMGPVVQFLSRIGINKQWLDPGVDTEVKWPLVYLFAILNGMGANVILLTSAMNRIPKELSEASRLDGCGFFREMTYVTVPLVMPTITTCGMMIFAATYNFFMQPMLIFENNSGKDGAFLTAPWQIFNLVADAGFDKQRLISAACLGIMLTLIVLPLNLIMRALLNRFTAEVSY